MPDRPRSARLRTRQKSRWSRRSEKSSWRSWKTGRHRVAILGGSQNLPERVRPDLGPSANGFRPSLISACLVKNFSLSKHFVERILKLWTNASSVKVFEEISTTRVNACAVFQGDGRNEGVNRGQGNT